MTAVDILKLYSPANSAALTQQQIFEMQSLTHEQIKQLARAYPNSSSVRAYLLIIDSKKSAEKQLPQLSTWENLYNLITKNGMKTFVAYGFRGATKQKPNTPVRARRSEVLDLSDAELKTLPGFKTGNTVQPETEMVVTRVRNKIPVEADMIPTQPPIIESNNGNAPATIELNTTNNP